MESRRRSDRSTDQSAGPNKSGGLDGGREGGAASLEEQRSHAAHLALLLHKDLKVLVDDGDGQQDPRPRADGAQEVGHDRQAADAQAAERCRRGDVPAGGDKTGLIQES